MQIPNLKKLTVLFGLLLAAALSWKWLLPAVLPFLLGALIALAADPLVNLLARRLPRGAATGIGVTGALLGVLTLLVLLTALLLRQLGSLTDHVPRLIGSANQGLETLRTTLTDLSQQAPEGLRPMLLGTVDRVFEGSGTVVEGFLQRLPAALSTVLSYLTTSALTVGTACLAAYMISARLPRLRQQLADPENPVGKVLPRLRRLRHALWGWLKAQLTLSGLCFLILSLGLLLLGVPYAPLWSFFIALVDAVPLLGTGTVLIPWALVCLLQGQQLRAIGLLVIYGITFLSRSALEPRLVGRQLGLDPLLTLVSLYAGFLFWGFGGMLAAPLVCVVVKEAMAGQ